MPAETHPHEVAATSIPHATAVAHWMGYPVLVRPSFILGGVKEQIVQSQHLLEVFLQERMTPTPERPVLLSPAPRPEPAAPAGTAGRQS